MAEQNDRLKWAREHAGYATASEAIKALGWRQSTYYGHENGDRAFDEVAAKRYATGYGVPWKWLIGGDDDPGATALGIAGTPAEVALPPSNISGTSVPLDVGAGTSIPVLGRAAGGDDGFFIADGDHTERVMVIPKLVGVPDAYAVYVRGDSMEPRYFSDEVVYVHPTRALRRDCFVVVQLHTDEPGTTHGYVKQYVTKTPTHLIVKQLNPEREIEFPLKRVKSVHRIVGSGDA